MTMPNLQPQRLKASFVRNVITLLTGTASAQVLTLAVAPFITRQYGSEAYGIFGTFTAILGIGAPLAALALPIAIVLSQNDREAFGLFRISLYIAVAWSIIIILTAPLICWSGAFDTFEEIGCSTAPLIAVGLIIIAFSQALRQWLVRKSGYALVAKSIFARAILSNSLKVGIGFFLANGLMLIVATLLGHIAQITYILRGMRRRDKLKFPSEVHYGVGELSQIARTFSDFPLYRAPQNLVNALSQNLPIVLLAITSGPSAAAFFALAKTVLGVPSGLLGEAFRDVFYPHAVDAERRGEPLLKLTLRATVLLLALGSVPFAFVATFGPSLFDLIFGDGWGVAGQYAQWLSLFFFFNFINKPLVAIVPIFKAQRGLLLYELLSTMLRTAAFLVAFMLSSNNLGPVAAYSVSGAFAYLLLMIWIVRTAKNGERSEKTS